MSTLALPIANPPRLLLLAMAHNMLTQVCKLLATHMPGTGRASAHDVRMTVLAKQALSSATAQAQYFFLKYLFPPASCKGTASSAAVSPRPLRFPERPLSASFICRTVACFTQGAAVHDVLGVS